ncbi:hypothetical protein D3C80_836880 [compost metagenome]
MVRQQLLIDVEEAFAIRLVQDRRADQFIVRQARVKRVIGRGFRLDHSSFFGGAPAGFDGDFAEGFIDICVDDESVGRVGLQQVLVDRSDVQIACLDDIEAGCACGVDQRVAAYAQTGAIGQIGGAGDVELELVGFGGVQRDDQIAVRADVQATDINLAGLTRVQRALGDVDVQQAIGVADRAAHDGAARDRQAVCASAERDVPLNQAVLNVEQVRARSQFDVAIGRRFARIRHAVAVGVRIGGSGLAGDPLLGEGDAGRVGADVDGCRLAGDGIASVVGRDIGLDRAGVGDRGQGAAEVGDGRGIGCAAARRNRDDAIIVERR